ncbi:MAG TPA: DEAD/DEAH box helicase [Candidatus Paceibacterota bacterium]|nr:DEAD/DEAH box helicase [Candidatus Paceibacterota bacterium]
MTVKNFSSSNTGSNNRRPTNRFSSSKSGGKSGVRYSQGGSQSSRHSSQSSRDNSQSSRRTSQSSRTRSSGKRFSSNSRGGNRTNRFSTHIDHSKFINKAIITEETNKFVPEHKFSDFHITDVLKKSVLGRGYLLPTPIQDRSIPHILRGVDVVGIAQTGTGKTAAFLLPLINKILLNTKEKVLVIVPTRELASQINDELKSFTKDMRIYSVCCVGGTNIGPQIASLRNFNHFIIGTPGRLKDLVNRGKIRLGEFKTIVLDEADRMLDMGFINDMRFIMDKMPSPRQTLFFSATISREVERLINDFLKEPVRIQVASRQTSDHIDQDIVKIPRGTDKMDMLRDVLIQPGFDKVLIFGRTKHGVEKLSKKLNQLGFKAESIHGNKTQGKRQKALDLFKRDHVNILVATDVAARGLDISGVSHVINFDIPATHDDYVHRIGRTGRAGKPGKALTFVD